MCSLFIVASALPLVFWLHQPDQLILSNPLPRPAARALFSLRLHSVSLAFRLCAPAPVVGDCMMMRESGNGSVMIDVIDVRTTTNRTFFALPFLLGVLCWLCTLCRVTPAYLCVSL